MSDRQLSRRGTAVLALGCGALLLASSYVAPLRSQAGVAAPGVLGLTSSGTSRQDNPLLGGWRQSGWKLCTPAPSLPAGSIDPPVEELLFNPDGTFSVTWTPFERYRDYWGHYKYSVVTKGAPPASGGVSPGATRRFPLYQASP